MEKAAFSGKEVFYPRAHEIALPRSKIKDPSLSLK
jgi:hypothetical protein